MPVQSTVPGLKVTRPEIYFGEMTDTDVYVKTHQQEFNYPQGQTNNLSSYEGTGGIVMGGFLRRALLAFDRGDLTKVPFSDDITADSRLLMRRNVLARVAALAPFLTFDHDPYIVVGDDGRLSWIIDAYTSSATYPYSAPVRSRGPTGQLHAQQREGGGRRLRRHRHVLRLRQRRSRSSLRGAASFPDLFKDASAMPAWLRAHVRYPEMLLSLQAEVYGLYHMTDPEVFYNREDQWTVATENGSSQGGDQSRAGHAAQLRADDAARRIGRPRVRRDSALHSHQPQQHDRLDRRAQRRRAITATPWSSTFPRRASSTARSRSKRASTRTRNSPASSRSGISRART